MRTCTQCNETKPLTEFYVNRTVKCRYKNNERIEKRCKDCIRTNERNIFRLRRYGMTLDEYLAAVSAVNSQCEICQEPCEKLCIDHNHTTNNNRGLLCQACNKLLGHAKDNKQILWNSIAYLSKYQE